MEKQFEYRIKYKHAQDVMTNYHYYMCESAEKALEYQHEMSEHHGWNVTLLQIERLCPWTKKWLDESQILETADGSL
jgi:hypothetical protein